MKDNASKTPLWRSKAVIIATIFSCLFLVLFYLAVSNEPDYMPSQQNKHIHTQQSSEKDSTPHSNMQMSDEEMKNMSHDHMSSSQAH